MAYQKQIYQDGITEYTEELFEHMDDGIFGAYPVQLIAISSTAPSTCATGDKYYNSTSKKIFTATGTNTWGSTGTTPLVDTSYWLISENGNYAWDGTDLVSIGGGKAEVVISDEEPEEGKLWVDTAEIPTIAGRDRLVNVGTEVNEDYRVNVLHSNNLFDGQLEQGTYNTSGNKQSDTTLYRNTNIIRVKPNTTYTFSINGVSQKYCLFYYTNTKTFISYDFTLTTGTFTTPANCYYINFRCFQADYTDNYANLKVQLQEGSVATPYEPYITPSIVVDNDEIYSKEEVLFSGNQSLSTSSTTLTLNKNITDYNLIEIYYVKYSGSDSILSSLKIFPINNGYISPQILFKATSNIIQQFWCLLKITTNAITLQDIGYVNYKISDNSVEVANNTGSFSIVKVIGYK